MTVREYIGARYVPLFMGEWDNTNTYEPLSIVTNQGNSYTSRQFVPVGVELTNGVYWAETGNFNGQLEQYRQEVERYSGNVEELSEVVDDLSDDLENEIITRQNNINEINEKINITNFSAGFNRVFAEVYAEFPFMFPENQTTGVRSMQAATMDANYFYIFGVGLNDTTQHLFVLPRYNTTWNFSNPPFEEYTYSNLGHCNSVCCDDEYIYIGGYSAVSGNSRNCFYRINKTSFEYVDSISTETVCSSITMYGENDEYIADCEGTTIYIYNKQTGETLKVIPLKNAFTQIGTKTLPKQGMSYDTYSKTFRICNSGFEQVLIYQEDGTFVSTLDFNLNGESTFEIEDSFDENGQHFLFLYQHNLGSLSYICVTYNDVYINNYERSNIAVVYEAQNTPYTHDLTSASRIVTTWMGLNFFIQNSIYERIEIIPTGNYTPLQGNINVTGIPYIRFSKPVELFFNYRNISALTDYPVYRLSSACRNLRVYAPNINIVIPTECYNMQIEAGRIGTTSDVSTVTLHECILCSSNNSEPASGYQVYWHKIPNLILNSSIINSAIDSAIDSNSKLINQNCISQ